MFPDLDVNIYLFRQLIELSHQDTKLTLGNPNIQNMLFLAVAQSRATSAFTWLSQIERKPTREKHSGLIGSERVQHGASFGKTIIFFYSLFPCNYGNTTITTTTNLPRPTIVHFILMRKENHL